MSEVNPSAAPSANTPPGNGSAAPEPTPEELQQELKTEVGNLVDRMRAANPAYTPPPFSAAGFMQALRDTAGKFTPSSVASLARKATGAVSSVVSADMLDLDFWKGIWYVLNYSVTSQVGTVKRRFTGEYETDQWGLDLEFADVVQPFVEFMYRRYWRVQTSGMENVPAEGRALLTVNHSGQLPWDGVMVGTAVYLEHPQQRWVRTLYASWFPTLPFFSAAFTKLGQATATVENGTRLLDEDQLVAVFPEGYKGVGKLFSERYRLARFGRGGFIRMALRSGAPVIPVSVVGAEETYISLYKSPTMAKLIGFPYFPISLTFPWLGLLGFVPLPTKWYIDFGEPIATDQYGPDAASNFVLVSQLTDQVRNIVQNMIYNRLAERRSVFFG